MSKPKNQRKKDRQSCVVPVDGKAFGNIRAVDISSGGMGLVCGKLPAVNEKIAVQVDLAPDAQSALVMMGEVRWVKPASESGTYRVGLEFTDVLSGRQTTRIS
jgi:c-di-GMP-binding flagellar brake protein YcgR